MSYGPSFGPHVPALGGLRREDLKGAAPSACRRAADALQLWSLRVACRSTSFFASFLARADELIE